MPRFDKTGPRGLGARTGRGLGDCEPNEIVETILGKETPSTTDENWGEIGCVGGRRIRSKGKGRGLGVGGGQGPIGRGRY